MPSYIDEDLAITLLKRTTLSIIRRNLLLVEDKCIVWRRVFDNGGTFSEHHSLSRRLKLDWPAGLTRFDSVLALACELTELVFGRLDKVLDLLNRQFDALQTDPFKCWFARI